MTKEDAIKYLKQLYPYGGHCWLDEQRIEAIGMAVKALQEEPVSMWHDASEEIPTSGSNILMIRKEEKDTNYPPIAGCFHGTNSRLDGKNWGYYNGFCYHEIEAPYKWAYIDDFLALEEIPPKFPIISQKENPVCAFSTNRYTDEDRKVLCDGCKEECEYAQKKEPISIWHDANIELPRKDKEVLALVIRPNLRAYVAFPSGHGTLYSLFGIIDINDVSKWCYIDDILNLSNIERTVKDWKEEPVSEELEDAEIGICSEILKGETIIIDGYEYIVISDAEKCFKAGAKWQKEELIQKAVEWIKEHKEVVETEDNGIIGWIPDYFIEDFKNFLNEE